MENPYAGYQKFTPAGLGDEGGGDVDWWHDYIRELVEAANDHGEWSAKRGYETGKAEQAKIVSELVEALDICVEWFRNEIVTQAVKDGRVPYFGGYKRSVMALARIPGHYTHTPCPDCGRIGRNNCPTCDDFAHEEAIAKAKGE